GRRRHCWSRSVSGRGCTRWTAARRGPRRRFTRVTDCAWRRWGCSWRRASRCRVSPERSRSRATWAERGPGVGALLRRRPGSALQLALDDSPEVRHHDLGEPGGEVVRVLRRQGDEADAYPGDDRGGQLGLLLLDAHPALGQRRGEHLGGALDEWAGLGGDQSEQLGLDLAGDQRTHQRVTAAGAQEAVDALLQGQFDLTRVALDGVADLPGERLGQLECVRLREALPVAERA